MILLLDAFVFFNSPFYKQHAFIDRKIRSWTLSSEEYDWKKTTTLCEIQICELVISRQNNKVTLLINIQITRFVWIQILACVLYIICIIYC